MFEKSEVALVVSVKPFVVDTVLIVPILVPCAV